jgi:uncharacterized protein (TIGR02246 family)
MLHKFSTVFVLILATIVVGTSPHISIAAESMTDARAKDYAAIQTLIVKYAHVYDSRDVEGYVSVFTEDAQFTFTGNALNGRGEIRDFITTVANSPVPDIKSYHSISNTLIEFVSDTEAHHVSYWQIVSGPVDGAFIVNNMGVYEDVIVKQNGQWLIQKRHIPQ